MYATGCVGALLAIAIFSMWRLLPRHPRNLVGPGRAFFTTDDGKTWFTGQATDIPPLACGGKTAYWVEVYRCSRRSSFAVNLETFDPADKAKVDQAIASGRDWNDVAHLMSGLHMLVKKPGDENWIAEIPENESRFRQIIRPVCPDGSADGLEKVDPNE